jgi:hypothetical protein
MPCRIQLLESKLRIPIFSHIPGASYSLDMGFNMRAERDRNLTRNYRHCLAHNQGYKDDKWYQNR